MSNKSHTAAGLPTPERQQWMDFARGLAIILVIIRHAGEIFKKIEPVKPEWLQAIDYALGPFRIPLLVFLSGMLLNRSLDKGLPRFVEGKVKNLLWPLLLWTVLWFIISGEKLHGPKFVLSGTYLWYIAFLASYFAVAIVAARVPHLVVACFALSIAMLAPDGTRYGEMLFLLMCYFFLGAFAGQNIDRFTAILQNRWTPFLALVAVALGILAVRMGGLRYETETAALAIISIVAICAIAYRLQRFWPSAPVSFVGRHSLIFYVVHYPLMLIVLKLLESAGLAFLEVFMLIAIPVSFIVPALIARSSEESTLFRPLFQMPLSATLLGSPAYRRPLKWLDKMFGVSDRKHRKSVI